MIADLATLPDRSTRECDVCIVGCGAAGLAIANELLESGLGVMVLESGGLDHEPETQRLYDCDFTGLPFPGAVEGRFRVFGGSTTMWGGQSLPLDELDFERRDWVAHSGWPIRRGDLAEPYERAAAFLATDPLNFDTDLFSLLGITPPAFDQAVAHYHFSKWAPTPDIRRLYRAKIEASTSTTLVLHANLVRIALGPEHDGVHELVARSLPAAGGKELTVRARHVVLATGAIEVARILLANSSQHKQGIGNDRGLVGRYLQDHPGGPLGIVHSDRPDRLQHLFNTFYKRGLKYTPRFSMAPELQRSRRVLNASALLAFDAGADAPYQRLKDALNAVRRRRATAADLRAALLTLPHAAAVLRPAAAYFLRGRVWTPSPTIRLAVLTEQEPCPDSRITLSRECDALGIPRSCVHWRLTDLTHKTIVAYAEGLRDEFARLGLGRNELDDWVRAGCTDWTARPRDQKHHMGTARMSKSPDEGVVDPACRVHGLENLWIASSAVFPTGGHSNPTLTLLALAIRLADELKRRLGGGGRSGAEVSPGAAALA